MNYATLSFLLSFCLLSTLGGMQLEKQPQYLELQTTGIYGSQLQQAIFKDLREKGRLKRHHKPENLVLYYQVNNKWAQLPPALFLVLSPETPIAWQFKKTVK